MSITTLHDITRVTCQPWKNGMGWDMGTVLALEDKSDGCIAVATPSWHVDFDEPITWPAMQDHRDDWLCSCHYGDYPPNSAAIKTAVADWLCYADLSSLDDNDDNDGHAALAQSLADAIKEAKAAHPQIPVIIAAA